MKNLLGREVSFVPFCFLYKCQMICDDLKQQRGRIVFIHKKHKWFLVRWKCGNTYQYEAFKFDSIGNEVTVYGYKKDH